MYSLSEITNIHLELSSFCNARCPMCARFDQRTGGLSPSLKQKHLSLRQIRNIFPPEFVPQLVYVYGCGVHGEPLLNPEALDIYEYFRRYRNDMILGGHTNGGVRDQSFWRELARVTSKINFSIDGLSDTNHLYRQHVEWEKLLENVQAYIAAGGFAIWNFLIFKHNEHQVEEARTLAKKLGFKQFIEKRTNRFFNFQDLQLLEHWPAFDRGGVQTHTLQPCSTATRAADQVTLTQTLERGHISCRAQKDRSLYVDSLGFVFPCCWLGGETVQKAPKNDFFSHLQKSGSTIDVFDSSRYSLAEIVNNKAFQKTVPESWQQDSFASGKLYSCARACGKELNNFASQFSEAQVLNP